MTNRHFLIIFSIDTTMMSVQKWPLNGNRSSHGRASREFLASAEASSLANGGRCGIVVSVHDQGSNAILMAAEEAAPSATSSSTAIRIAQTQNPLARPTHGTTPRSAESPESARAASRYPFASE